MKNILQIIMTSLFFCGVYLFVLEIFVPLPKRTVQAVAKEKNFSFAQKYSKLQKRIASLYIPHLKLSKYKEEEYSRILEALGKNETPTEFIAVVLAKSLLLTIPIFLMGIWKPAVLLIGVGCAGYIYIDSTTEVKKKYEIRRREIEKDLPKFCSVINSKIQSTSNVVQILETYLPVATPAMRKELEITLNDMRTGNVATALSRFDKRINSIKVSDITRGLISVNAGAEQMAYFQIKQQQFQNDYFMQKKKEISQRVLKLSPPMMVVFLFFFGIILYPMVVSIGEAMKHM